MNGCLGGEGRERPSNSASVSYYAPLRFQRAADSCEVPECYLCGISSAIAVCVRRVHGKTKDLYGVVPV
jgi:hypothetical protein